MRCHVRNSNGSDPWPSRAGPTGQSQGIKSLEMQMEGVEQFFPAHDEMCDLRLPRKLYWLVSFANWATLLTVMWSERDDVQAAHEKSRRPPMSITFLSRSSGKLVADFLEFYPRGESCEPSNGPRETVCIAHLAETGRIRLDKKQQRWSFCFFTSQVDGVL